MQKAAFPDMPHYVAPNDIQEILRPKTRKETIWIHALSPAIIADNEKDVRSFVTLLNKRKAIVKFKEDDCIWSFDGDVKSYIEHWRKARKNGVATIGGRISAEKRKADSKTGVEKIRDRWGMPSRTWPTRVLLDEADLSLNTVKAHLGSRIVAQHNYQGAQKRKERKLTHAVKA